MAKQFVMGRTIAEALERAERDAETLGYRHSYDMLGEAALTAHDAKRYLDSYAIAIDTIGKAALREHQGDALVERANISVKLSALHPRYEALRPARARAGRARARPAHARRSGPRPPASASPSTRRRADRLDLSLDVIAAGLSLAHAWLVTTVSASRCRPTSEARHRRGRLGRGARQRGRSPHLMVRLVKGAYWDSEVKRASGARPAGLSGLHPQVQHRPVSYLACARTLLDAGRMRSIRNVRHPQRAHHAG